MSEMVGGRLAMDEFQLENVKAAVESCRIFSCSFRTRTGDDMIRHMVCKYVGAGNGRGNMGYDPDKKNLLLVYDCQKKGFRMISIEGIIWIRIDGEVYYV